MKELRILRWLVTFLIIICFALIVMAVRNYIVSSAAAEHNWCTNLDGVTIYEDNMYKCVREVK